MRVLFIDIDTLRPDHLGCYGYHRNTSPNIDRIASEGVRFDNCYVTDAPCLPSRASLWTGRFGIHTGIVGHGGTSADLRVEGETREFRTDNARLPWMAALRNAGVYTASVSTFAERHSAFWFYHGFNEIYNQGGGGTENADEIEPYVLDWIEKNAERDNWFFHVHTWDPHTPYSTPEEYGNPFEDEPPADWLTEEMIEVHRESFGPHSARELQGWDDVTEWPRLPADISSLADFKKWIDGYDVGIRYGDDQIGKILDILEAKGVLDETAIIVSSDHGENQGELNIYGDHATADHITSRVPLIIRWPGVTTPRVDRAFHYQTDLAPTVSELLA